jgi:PKD repeat protein
LRSRQTGDSQKNITKKQRNQAIEVNKSTISGMNNIPVNYFEPATIGMGILGTGLLRPRPDAVYDYGNATNALGKPIFSNKGIANWTHFFVEYNNQNTSNLQAVLKSFVIIRTRSYMPINDVKKMLGNTYKSVTGITKDQYDNSSFSHPTYLNDSSEPLQIRYAEIPIQIQRTPGRLDDVPIGSPSFDSTPDGVTTRKGPIPTPPYTNFATATGATASIQIIPGGSVLFKDTSVSSPWQFAPTGWIWNFGATASPTGSIIQNPTVTYGVTGTYTVTLTASNAAGSTPKTKTGFVIVTY